MGVGTHSLPEEGKWLLVFVQPSVLQHHLQQVGVGLPGEQAEAVPGKGSGLRVNAQEAKVAENPWAVPSKLRAKWWRGVAPPLLLPGTAQSDGLEGLPHFVLLVD